MSIADRLIEARGEIPRAKVCDDLGIAYSTLTMYELGKRVPKDEIKVKLARYYGQSVESLFFAAS